MIAPAVVPFVAMQLHVNGDRHRAMTGCMRRASIAFSVVRWFAFNGSPTSPALFVMAFTAPTMVGPALGSRSSLATADSSAP